VAEFEVLLERPNARDCPVDVEVGEMLPVVTLVTDNGGPFRAFRFETLISQHLEPWHVRIWVKSLGHFLTRATQVDIQPQASSPPPAR
jgi:putative transposase